VKKNYALILSRNIFSNLLHEMFHRRFSRNARSMFFNSLFWFLSLYSSFFLFFASSFPFLRTDSDDHLLLILHFSPILQTHVEALTFILLSVGFFIQLSECRRNSRSLNQDSPGIICKYTNPFCFSLVGSKFFMDILRVSGRYLYMECF